MSTMEKLIDSLLASGDSIPFREPVDWRGLGLDDYPAIIKRPMDLGTVKLRLEQGAYSTGEECAADVRLIWDNCRTYNHGGIPRKLHRSADNLSKRFETRFAKLPAGGGLQSSTGGSGSGGGKGKGKRAKSAKGAAEVAAPTDEERRRLARHLGRARMEDVTSAVHEIDRRCPGALVLKGDAIEIDVDALDTWTFCAVERVVAPLAAQRRASRATARRGRKKRKTSSNSGSGAAPQGGGGAAGGGGQGGQVAGAAKGAARPCKRAKVETSPS